MKKELMSIILLTVFCLSGCISINNAPVMTPAVPMPTTSAPIRTSEEQTPVQMPVTTSVTTPCTTCGYYQYPQTYQRSTYQYPCTICPQVSPAIYQYPAKPTTVLPVGWEWYWDGSQWINRQIPGYIPVKPTTILPAGWEWYWDGSQWISRQYFVPIPTSTPVTPVPATISNVQITALGDPSSSHWRAQTFAGTAMTLTRISVVMEKVNNPGDVVCDLMLVNAKGHPYGAVLASCTASSSSITSKSSYSFPLSYSLSPSVTYAIVFHTIGNKKNLYNFYGTKNNSYVSGCTELSDDSGRTWRSYYQLDMSFTIN